MDRTSDDGSNYEYTLGGELTGIEGLHGQNPETGYSTEGRSSYLGEYTTRLFGAPFQLLDSVDRRFPSVNGHVGNEYLRNFLLNSPILHIKPGMPKYTGADDATSIAKGLKNIYMDTTVGDTSLVESLVNNLASSVIFGKGAKLQKRLFGFRETYYEYMSHVNYMCRSVAIFLSLTGGNGLPGGTFVSGGGDMTDFSTMDWQNYRMMANSTVSNPMDYLGDMIGSTFLGRLGSGVSALGSMSWGDKTGSQLLEEYGINVKDAWTNSSRESIASTMGRKVTSVQFMVEPISFDEGLTNMTKPSIIESTIDGITNSIGNEISFMTNSNADLGVIDDLTGFLGDTAASSAEFLSGIVAPVTGGFMSNLFSGALQSIKGQKMLYPEIYASSNSTMDYKFDMTLTSPYGDIYNYYMNIIVPLLHLIALASPRLVSANTTTSPYLVQAYIPGMCTCNLGIVSSMTIIKNPTTKHVSVNGFPLTIKVSFTVKDLYNAMAISPANDPASFLFNETLNDYMSNLAGLIPSIDTYSQQRKSMFSNLNDYLGSGEWINDIVSPWVEGVEDTWNAYTGR